MEKRSQESSYLARLDSEIRKFLQKILSQGYYFTLVGGCVRDFHLNNHFPSDLDCEIRVGEIPSGESWEGLLEKLKSNLQAEGYQVESLPFAILRISLGQFQLELASPRRETFIPGQFSHKNFTTHLSPFLSYEESFVRRDFTVNAIGVEVKEWSHELLIDPFSGLKDLQNKRLHPCGANFFKDPVRFLRAIRFSQLMEWQWSEELEKMIPLFNLSQLGRYHFLYEGWKSGNLFLFTQKFFQLVDHFSLPLAPVIKDLRPLTKLTPTKALKELKDLLVILVKSEHLTKEEMGDLIKFFQLKESIFTAYRKYWSSLKDGGGSGNSDDQQKLKLLKRVQADPWGILAYLI